jgi:hypothetical protein
LRRIRSADRVLALVREGDDRTSLAEMSCETIDVVQNRRNRTGIDVW